MDYENKIFKINIDPTLDLIKHLYCLFVISRGMH